MKEFDLEALRNTPKPETKPEPTVAERIAELEAQIANLETKRNEPSALEHFQNLSPAAQQAEIDAMNHDLPPEEQYTVESYLAELTPAPGTVNPDISDLRIQVLQAELEALRSHT